LWRWHRLAATVGQCSARGQPATVLAAHPDDAQREVAARGRLLAGCREERAISGGRATTLLRYLEPPLDRLRALEESLDFAELLPRERAHRRAEAVGPVDQLLDPGDAYYVGPGHTPILYAGTEVVEFSPTVELGQTMEVVTKNMEQAETALS
jgi:hypothetical protein